MWQKRAIICLLIIPAIAGLSVAAVSASAGVGISPGRLHFENGAPGSIQSLYVINTGTERANYEVFAEEEYASWFQIDPPTFALEPDQNKEVKISVARPKNAIGEHATMISVTAFAQSAEDRVGTGVKVPAVISIDSNELQSGAGVKVPTHISLEANDVDGEDDISPQRSTATRLWIYLPAVIAALLAAAILIMVYRRKRIA